MLKSVKAGNDHPPTTNPRRERRLHQERHFVRNLKNDSELVLTEQGTNGRPYVESKLSGVGRKAKDTAGAAPEAKPARPDAKASSGTRAPTSSARPASGSTPSSSGSGIPPVVRPDVQWTHSGGSRRWHVSLRR
jgi:hypothetical protein